MNHMSNPVWKSGLLGSITMVFLFLAGCSAEAPPLSKQTIHPVKLVTLDAARVSGLKQYPGKVAASEHSELSFRVGGELIRLTVKAGDTVEQGEVVARLDERDAQVQLENAQSSFNLAEATFERMRISLERNAISQARFDEAEAQYLSAKAELSRARDQLSYTSLKAPFSGVISRIPVEVYQVVGAQQTIVELQRPGSIDVTFQMPEQDIRQVRPERAESARESADPMAWVSFSERPDQRYEASYKEHDSHATRGSLSYEVTVTLPAPEDTTVLSGMSASVLLDFNALTGGENAFWLVPAGAITAAESNPDEAVVWRYVSKAEDEGEEIGQVEPVAVTPGAKTSEGVLLKGQIEAGDRIVSAGAHLMSEGRKVRPWVKEGGL